MPKKYSVRVRHRMPDRVSSKVFTLKALSIADALVQFERTAQRDYTFEDIEVEAVWQCSSCECRAKRRRSI